MRAPCRRLAVVSVAVAVVAAIAGCAGSSTTAPTSPSAGTPGLATRTATAGPVEVTVTPTRVDPAGARFAVELNNHAIDLDGDYAATSTLTVNGTRWSPAAWSGTGPGGHHRSGTLTFTATGAPTGTAQLRLGGLPAPVILTWTFSVR